MTCPTVKSLCFMLTAAARAAKKSWDGDVKSQLEHEFLPDLSRKTRRMTMARAHAIIGS